MGDARETRRSGEIRKPIPMYVETDFSRVALIDDGAVPWAVRVGSPKRKGCFSQGFM